MDRLSQATIRATDIMNKLYAAGWNKLDTYSIESLDLPEGICYANGASRFVVWDDNNPDYVIKIGIREEDDKYNRREVELYHAATEARVESQFGWCAYVGDYCGREIYAMEFLESSSVYNEDKSYEWGLKKYCSDNDLDSNSSEVLEAYHDYYWDRMYDSEMILEWFESSLTISEMRKFDAFVCKHNITDIHAANIGYRDEKLVILDYAGWGW